jgi:hypothetical protein
MADSVLYFRMWDRLQRVFRRDVATLDKALEMKVNFYAAHLKGWAWIRRIGQVDQG